MSRSAKWRASLRAGLPVEVIGKRLTDRIWRGCQYLGSIRRQTDFTLSTSPCSVSSTTCSPKRSSLAHVTRKGAARCGCSFRSTSSICILMPPEQMTLSLRPSIRKRLTFCEFLCKLPHSSFTSNSTMSLVISRPSCTAGASITKQPSSLSDRLTLSNGMYHSDRSGPLRRRRAICERVSVMPYELHTAFGKSFNSRAKVSSIAPPPIMSCLICISCSLSSGTCNEFQTCSGTIAAKVHKENCPFCLISRNGCPLGSTSMRRNPRVSALTTIILPAMKSSGRHSRAVSPSCSSRKSHVIRAEASMRRFSTNIGFGLPVDPLVCTSTVSEELFHSSRNSPSVNCYL